MNDTALVTRTAPENLRGIALRFDPARGVVADEFPRKTAFTDAMLFKAREMPGLIEIHGQGGIGTTVQFNAANGEAVYELKSRIQLTTGDKGFTAARRSVKPLLVGKEVEVDTFDDLESFTDKWPMIAGFTPRFFTLSPHVWRAGPKLIVVADGCTAEYTLELPHPCYRGGWLGQRLKLKTPTGTNVTVPVASARSIQLDSKGATNGKRSR